MARAVNSSVTDAMHADASPWAWLSRHSSCTTKPDKPIPNGKLDEAVRKAVEAFNEQKPEAPRNAGLDYDTAAARVRRARSRPSALRLMPIRWPRR